MGSRREFKNSQDFVDLPARTSYTHVRKLCCPKGRGDRVKLAKRPASRAGI